MKPDKRNLWNIFGMILLQVVLSVAMLKLLPYVRHVFHTVGSQTIVEHICGEMTFFLVLILTFIIPMSYVYKANPRIWFPLSYPLQLVLLCYIYFGMRRWWPHTELLWHMLACVAFIFAFQGIVSSVKAEKKIFVIANLLTLIAASHIIMQMSSWVTFVE